MEQEDGDARQCMGRNGGQARPHQSGLYPCPELADSHDHLQVETPPSQPVPAAPVADATAAADAAVDANAEASGD